MKQWIVQSTGLAMGENEERLVDSLKVANVPLFDIGTIPFTNEITGMEAVPLEPSFLHCSTKMLKILSGPAPATEVFPHMGPIEAQEHLDFLKTSIFYDVNAFDQNLYRRNRHLQEERALLNWDARIVPLGHVLHEELLKDTFIKPTQDLKLFKGDVIPAGWTLDRFVREGTIDQSYLDACDNAAFAGKSNVSLPQWRDALQSKTSDDPVDIWVVMAPVKTILKEWRFFVVDREVVTGSQYMVQGRVKYDENIPPRVRSMADYFAKLYQPARAFVMDLGLLDSDLIKIVEYNCINASGFYHSDIGKLARRLMTT